MSVMPASSIARATGIGCRCSAANMVTSSRTVTSGSSAPPCSMAPTRPACTAAHRSCTEDRDLAGVRPGQAQQHVDGGGLAGPVGSEERHHLAGCDLQVDPADGVDVPEALVQAGHPDRSAIRVGLALSGEGRFSVMDQACRPAGAAPCVGRHDLAMTNVMTRRHEPPADAVSAGGFEQKRLQFLLFQRIDNVLGLPECQRDDGQGRVGSGAGGEHRAIGDEQVGDVMRPAELVDDAILGS